MALLYDKDLVAGVSRTFVVTIGFSALLPTNPFAETISLDPVSVETLFSPGSFRSKIEKSLRNAKRFAFLLERR